MFSSKKNTIIVYSIIYVVLMLLSAIGFFFSCYEAFTVISISGFFALGHLLVCMFYGDKPPKENESPALKMYFLIAFRGLFVVLSIVIPAIILYFVQNPALESMGNMRYLFVLLSFLPLATSLGLFTIWSGKQ